jgi:hypothetical protein
MPERYRVNGRFASRAQAEEASASGFSVLRELFSGKSLQSREEFRYVEEPEEEAYFEPNWNRNSTPHGGEIWSTQYYDESGKPKGDIEYLDQGALSQSEFPYQYEAYKVIYSVIGDPAYPRGYMTSDALYENEWPPKPAESQGADGIVAIRFY